MVRGGGEKTRKIAVALGASFIMLMMVAQPVSASDLTGSISDPQGDANRWVNKNRVIPDYLDIKAATLTLDTESDTYTLTMKMYGAIPDKPMLFNGIHTLFWQWIIDVDGGPYPYSHWIYTYEEYTVCVMWDGKAWSAELMDFSEMQEPGEYLVREIAEDDFEVLGDEISVTMPSWWIGDVESCGWAVGDNGFMSPIPVSDSYAWWFFDMAGFDMATETFTAWPA